MGPPGGAPGMQQPQARPAGPLGPGGAPNTGNLFGNTGPLGGPPGGVRPPAPQ